MAQLVESKHVAALLSVLFAFALAFFAADNTVALADEVVDTQEVAQELTVDADGAQQPELVEADLALEGDSEASEDASLAAESGDSDEDEADAGEAAEAAEAVEATDASEPEPTQEDANAALGADPISSSVATPQGKTSDGRTLSNIATILPNKESYAPGETITISIDFFVFAESRILYSVRAKDPVICTYDNGSTFLPTKKDSLTYEFTMPDSAVTAVTVYYDRNYDISIANTVVNGSIEPNRWAAAEGDEIELTITPAAGFQLKSGTLACNNNSSTRYIRQVSGKYILTMPKDDAVLSAEFELIPHAINIAEGITCGTVTASAATATAGTPITLTATPQEGYRLKEGTLKMVGADNVEVAPNADGTYTMPASDVTVSAEFERIYTVTVELGEGHESLASSSFGALDGFTVDGSTVSCVYPAGTNGYDIVQELTQALPDASFTIDNGDHFYGYGFKPLDQYADLEEVIADIGSLEEPLGSDLTICAMWTKPAGTVELTVAVPPCGTEVANGEASGEGVSPRAEVTVTSENAEVYEDSSGYWFFDEACDEALTGTIVGGTDYYTQIDLGPAFGYFFDEKTTVSLSGADLAWSNAGEYEYGIGVIAKVTAEHDWDEGKVTAEPTCTEKGVKTFTCAGCGETRTEEVDALGHDWGEWQLTKEPTATEEGVETHACRNDPAHTETRSVPARGEATYAVASGNGSTWTKGSATTLDFVVKRSVDDEETFGRFAGVRVDGADVPASGFAATAGSVNLSLRPAYLEGLSAGSHTLTAVFDDGSAQGSFTIIESSQPTAPVAPQSPSTPAQGNAAPKAGGIPRTGDDTWLGLAGASAVLSLVTLAGGSLLLRRGVRGE